MFTFVLFANGREIENVDCGTFETEQEARLAGESALDDYCPPHSANRRYYRVETTTANG